MPNVDRMIREHFVSPLSNKNMQEITDLIRGNEAIVMDKVRGNKQREDTDTVTLVLQGSWPSPVTSTALEEAMSPLMTS